MSVAERARPKVTPARSPLAAVVVVTVVSLVGAAVSVRSGLNPTYLDALGPDGHLSVPLPMTAFQVLTALAAGSRRRAPAMLGSGLLAVAVALAVVSGLFDGGYADARLDAGQRIHQLVLVAGLCAVALLAAVRFLRVWRAGAAAPAG